MIFEVTSNPTHSVIHKGPGSFAAVGKFLMLSCVATGAQNSITLLL